MKLRLFAVCFAATLTSGVGLTHASQLNMSLDEARAAAPLVAAMVVSGRSVVAKHQDLINDPDKADKGFTPDYVSELMIEDFVARTGQDPDAIDNGNIRQAVQATLDASRQAVGNNQARINEAGKKFKGFIPAVYGRITGNVLRGRSGIDLKQTTMQYRNAYNRPDEFETRILGEFEKTRPKQGYGEVVGKQYRYMQPIYIAAACLGCHGDPKGELDIAGKPKEGYKLGDLRGAISVSIPLN